MIVVVQTHWCEAPQLNPQGFPVIGTGGVVREQLRTDSVFLQFEPPALRVADKHATERKPCKASWKEGALPAWVRALRETVRAVKHAKQIDGIPTIYLGVGTGAAAAVQLSTLDDDAAEIVLVNAAPFPAPTKARRRVPVTLFHSADNEYVAVDQAKAMRDSARALGQEASLVVFENAGYDFGIREGRVECFELLAQTLAARLRARSSSSATTSMRCEPDQAPPELPKGMEIRKLRNEADGG